MTQQPTHKNHSILLWSATGILFVGMLFARLVYPELLWLTAVLGVALVASLAALVQANRAALRSRTAAYGLNSAVTILLILGIVGVLNFMGDKYPYKLDLTRNKLHTLSQQSVQVVKGLKKDVHATLFAKMGQREKFRPLLDDYRTLSPRFSVEYIDPDREPMRAKAAGITRYGTLQLSLGERDSKVEDPTEEKVTNALIKLLKDKEPTLCTITGHGEKNFNSRDAEGLESARKGLVGQAYEVKDVELAKEGKVPADCDAVAIWGPTKGFFEPEVKALRDYLDDGGRALIAIDPNVKGDGEYSPEIGELLADWYVKPEMGMIIDPVSRVVGVDASVPIITTYAKDQAITKDFSTNCLFPFVRPLAILPGAPSSLKVHWLAQTNPTSINVTDFKMLASGHARLDRSKQGALDIAVTVEGKTKDSKAKRDTRLVVFGSSAFATNNFARYGGNMDFFLNAASWAMEDDSLISIRAKDEGPSRIELSQKQASFIELLTIILLPLGIAVGGVVNWAVRRRL